MILLEQGTARAGRILDLGPAADLARRHGLDLAAIPQEPGLFLPAFYDPHFHWVQDHVRALPKTSLIEWLTTYTFPAEAKFADPEFAAAEAAVFWQRIVQTGTIGGLCYSSIHETALDAAMACAPEDFRIGNVLMTMNCPDTLCQTEAEAIRSVQACAERYGERYVCSPRFAPTTAPDVMRAAAQAAHQHACFQQTHLDETLAEIDWVLGLYRSRAGFESVSSYTDIYRRVGMLGPRTVFGHCIHVRDDEWRMLADSGSWIASCPTSNAPIEQLGLGSGLFDYEQAEAYNVPWALASDIGGGPFLSMLDVMQSFVQQNRAAGREASYSKALHRSTAKAAEACGMASDRGRLQPGAYFDAIRVPLPQAVLADHAAEHVLELLLGGIESREATDAFVLETYIRGESRYRSTEQ